MKSLRLINQILGEEAFALFSVVGGVPLFASEVVRITREPLSLLGKPRLVFAIYGIGNDVCMFDSIKQLGDERYELGLTGSRLDVVLETCDSVEKARQLLKCGIGVKS